MLKTAVLELIYLFKDKRKYFSTFRAKAFFLRRLVASSYTYPLTKGLIAGNVEKHFLLSLHSFTKSSQEPLFYESYLQVPPRLGIVLCLPVGK